MGVVIGAAFSKIVTLLVNDIIMPLIRIILGGIDFTNLNIQIKNAVMNYGAFIQNIIVFLIISICIFIPMEIYCFSNRQDTC